MSFDRLTPEALKRLIGAGKVPVPADKAALAASMARHYPPDLRAAGVGGSVLVDVTIDENGVVREVEVVPRPAGPAPRAVIVERDPSTGRERHRPMALDDNPAFARAAREALRELRFSPATNDGEPVAFKLRMTVRFTPPWGNS